MNGKLIVVSMCGMYVCCLPLKPHLHRVEVGTQHAVDEVRGWCVTRPHTHRALHHPRRRQPCMGEPHTLFCVCKRLTKSRTAGCGHTDCHKQAVSCVRPSALTRTPGMPMALGLTDTWLVPWTHSTAGVCIPAASPSMLTGDTPALLPTYHVLQLQLTAKIINSMATEISIRYVIPPWLYACTNNPRTSA